MRPDRIVSSHSPGGAHSCSLLGAISELNRSPMKFPYSVLLASLLCACSDMPPDAGANSQALQNSSRLLPRDYRQIIADELRDAIKYPSATPSNQQTDAQRKTTSTLIGAQVSDLRNTTGPQLGDWVACLKIDRPNTVQYVAVFFENGKISNFRTAVGIDQCPNETYWPLPPPKQNNKAAKVQ